jgi:hypothetical protein
MKIKTSELTGTALDWAVAKCEGLGYRYDDKYGPMCFRPSNVLGSVVWDNLPLPYSSSWTYGGPIIERELLEITPRFYSAGNRYPKGLWRWLAYVLGPNNIDENFESEGPAPLIAAMRCYVASKLGDDVEVPYGIPS